MRFPVELKVVSSAPALVNRATAAWYKSDPSLPTTEMRGRPYLSPIYPPSSAGHRQSPGDDPGWSGNEGLSLFIPAAGIVATLAGPITGVGTLAKQDAGMVVLTSSASSHKGDILVDAGTLRINGSLPTTTTIFVRTGGRLEGIGSTAATIDVASTGTLAPGNSVGTFNVGSLLTAGSTAIEIDAAAPAADLLDVLGTVSLGGSLDLSITGIPSGWTGGTFLLINNDNSDAVTGSFATITGVPSGFITSVSYSFIGVDSLGRVGNGNDVVLTIAVPEPATLTALAGAAMVALKRRRAK
jgi:autotransporter-associated beta strand protein